MLECFAAYLTQPWLRQRPPCSVLRSPVQLPCPQPAPVEATSPLAHCNAARWAILARTPAALSLHTDLAGCATTPRAARADGGRRWADMVSSCCSYTVCTSNRKKLSGPAETTSIWHGGASTALRGHASFSWQTLRVLRMLRILCMLPAVLVSVCNAPARVSVAARAGDGGLPAHSSCFQSTEPHVIWSAVTVSEGCCCGRQVLERPLARGAFTCACTLRACAAVSAAATPRSVSEDAQHLCLIIRRIRRIRAADAANQGGGCGESGRRMRRIRAADAANQGGGGGESGRRIRRVRAADAANQGGGCGESGRRMRG